MAKPKRSFPSDPIRDTEKLAALQRSMMDAGLVRECLLFQLQYNTNLRVSDALRLRWADVLDADRNIVQTVSLLEKKIAHTGRYKKVMLNSQIRASLLNYYHRYKPKPREFIFRSQSNRIGYRNRAWNPNWPRKVFNEHARKVGIQGHIGTHSPRKTFGWMAYNVLGMPLEEIMVLLNHTDPRVTAIYCGITEDKQRQQYEQVAEVNCAADGLIRADRLPDNTWREKALARHRRRGYKKTKKKA